MKILHIISSANPIHGGPIQGIKELNKAYRKNNILLDVCTNDMPNDPWVKDSELVIHAIGPGFGKYSFNPKFIPWLRLHHHKYDAVILNGLWQYHGFAAHRVMAKSNIPYYIFPHGMLDPWFKFNRPFKHIKKWLYWYLVEYRVLRDAKKVIFTSKEESLSSRKLFWLYKVNEIICPYGISAPPSDYKKLKKYFLSKFPHLKDKRIFLFFGRIHEKKGCDLLIEAFAIIARRDSRLHLLMAGPGSMNLVKKLKNMTAKLKISSQVTWTDMLLGDLKWGAIYYSEVFCLPSHQENFGIAVVEALSCGKPVLISNKVNIWREIKVDNAGFVAEDTFNGTLQNLQRWISIGDYKIDQMKSNARSCYKKNFSIQTNKTLVRELIEGKFDFKK